MEHYLKLKKHYLHVKEGKETQSSISEVSQILCCTMRNANIILNKLKENDLITWISQRGRGKKSRLTFKKSLTNAANEHLLTLINEKGLESGYEFISSADFPNETMISLYNLFESQFGFRSITKEKGQKDILTISHPSEINTLDPAKVSIVNEAHLVTQIFDRLVLYDEKAKSVVPHLVHYWENKDGLKWTFYLRKGVMFHHQKELTSEDVVYTFNRLIKEDSPVLKSLFEDIQYVEAKGLYTVNFYLYKHNYVFPYLLSSIYASILPGDVPFEATMPIGSGPFQVTKHTNEKLTLNVFQKYFKERAFLDQVDILFTPRIKEKMTFIEENKKSEKTFNQNRIENGSYCFFFNFRKKGIHNEYYFRKALNTLLDKKQLITDLKGERAFPSSSFTPFNSASVNKIEHSSIEEAKKYLNMSNYQGEGLFLTVFDYKPFLEDVQWFKVQCEKVGVNINIRKSSISQLQNKETLINTDILYGGVIMDENYDIAMFNLYHRNPIVRQFFNDEYLNRVDLSLELAKKEKNFKARKQIYDRIEHFITNQLLILYSYHTFDEPQFSELMKGLEVNNYGWIDFRKTWIKVDSSGNLQPHMIIF
ncbi:ABC transporter substrate-binding protein [Bacillus shivajii]|uniref:ABC transporter substrate-binding protein n=1 Tax=Bacillus shivajii TaxID=1983719 RepID=UPI001CF9ADAF|nr:ABC transporter substrate-binding protein [Bacillus shivajii]UCZ55053.1 ABC transporter substrate-binding protein [Bacillus shivajii]